MNLVQKLPIGLSLACLMFMSSCSKEDTLTPEPQMESVNGHSNAKVQGGIVVGAFANFPSTEGETGFNVYPLNWKRAIKSYFSNDIQKFPTGTSNFSQLWGNPSNPWIKSLPPVAGRSNGSVVTFSTNESSFNNLDYKSSGVIATLKNLVPGQKYQITFHVASTIPLLQNYTASAVYANRACIVMSNTNSAKSHYLWLAEGAKWATKTIEFQASQSEMNFQISAINPQPNQYSFVNIFVDKNSIKKID